jgi:hypothetical protein
MAGIFHFHHFHSTWLSSAVIRECPEEFVSFRRRSGLLGLPTQLNILKNAVIDDSETGSSPGNLLYLLCCNAFWELRALLFPENMINWNVESTFLHFHK